MQKYILAGVFGLALAGGAFFGGMKYGQRGTAGAFAGQDRQMFANLSPEERQARFQQMGVATFNGMGGARGTGIRGRGNGQLLTGEILSKDDTSITVKLPDGGSRIIFLSAETQIMKTVQTAAGDISTGSQITVTGAPNSDGSMTAQNIQIRQTQ